MLTDLEKAYFDKHKIPYPTRELDPIKVAAARKIWARQLRNKSAEEIEAHAKGHVAWAEREIIEVPPEQWIPDKPSESSDKPQTVNVHVDCRGKHDDIFTSTGLHRGDVRR